VGSLIAEGQKKQGTPFFVNGGAFAGFVLFFVQQLLLFTLHCPCQFSTYCFYTVLRNIYSFNSQIDAILHKL